MPSELPRRETRFVPEPTTSTLFTCWTLYAGDHVLASVLTGSGVGPDAAWSMLREKQRNDAAVLSAIDALAEESSHA